MRGVKLTEDTVYNVAYEHGGWLGNFSGKFIDSDMLCAWFSIDGKIAVVRKVDIVFAIPIAERK